ncbi:hypothetical protein OQ496_03245 [Acetobacter suratthaniensis]|uniref:Uncharacterized protein n=1 Tax=Acetobacter suratthaniensis TaxID=1502841 RepID=A0ABS3LH53_9PROT|nr:hypothetical protein [Acetobacter suratthaniensis]MBO1326918.1 hypothetical protein [Acetobacter suratthaniensis]MCX2565472.1 hypothetical protein [Acetobacter suratthaniensis]
MKEHVSRTGRTALRIAQHRYIHARNLRHATALLALLSLTACGYNDSRSAHKGQLAVIGMTNEDLQACAGIPDKTARLDDHVQIFQYTRTINVPSTNDSTLFPLQTMVNLTQTSMGGAGKTCIASIRLVDGRVTDMHYSGDNDRMIGSDGVCATLVKGCLTTPPASAHSVSNNPIFGPVSAFHAPSLPVPGAPKPHEPAVHYTTATAPQDTLDPLPAPVSGLPDAASTNAAPAASPEQGTSPSLPQLPAQPATPPALDTATSSPNAVATTAKAAPASPAPAQASTAQGAASATPAHDAPTLTTGTTESSNQAAAIDPTNPDAAPESTCPPPSSPANSRTQTSATSTEKAEAPCAAPLDHKS